MSTQSLNDGIKKAAVANNSISTNQNQREKTIDFAKLKVALFETTFQITKPKHPFLDEILRDIESDKYKNLFENVANSDIKDFIKRNKTHCCTLSVDCNHRKAGYSEDKIISYTNLIQIDIDKIPFDKFEEVRKLLINDKHTAFCFRSISGNGLKAAFIVDHKRHKESFEAIEKYFKTEYNLEIDPSVKDLFRLCFISYDPNIYIDEYAEPFLLDDSHVVSKGVLAPNKQNTNKSIVPPRFDEIKKHKASITSRETKKNVPIIDSTETLLDYLKGMLFERGELGKRHNTRMEAGKIFGNFLSQTPYNLDEAVNLLLNFIVENNLTSDEELAKKELYQFISYGMNYKKTFSKQKTVTNGAFWTITENEAGKKTLTINNYHLLLFLSQSGLHNVNLGNNNKPNYRFVSLKNNIIENVSDEQLSSLFREFIDQLEIDEKDKGFIIGELFDIIPYLTDPRKLKFGLEIKEIKFLKDSKDKSFFFFNNTVLEVSKNGINLVDYSDINGVVWRSNIIDKDFEPLLDDDIDNSLFSKFITNTCKDKDSFILDVDRHLSQRITIGYHLHRYKTPRNNKSIVYSENNLESVANGRTGKSLIMKGISHCRNTLKLDGRRLKLGNEFIFQHLDYDTEIIYIDDIDRFMKFETFYPTISEGVRFRRIYEAEQWIPFHDSPKFALSTNYGLQGNSESDKARRFDMELLSYYNATRTPALEFDSYFFDEWDDYEWNLFYNYMLQCVKLYFENDCQLKEYKSDTLELKKLVSAIGKNFYEFAETLQRDEFIPNSEIYSLYVSFLGVDDADIPKKGIAYKIKTYCETLGLEFESKQQRVDNKNCRGYIIYSKIQDIQSSSLLGGVA